MTWFSGDPDQLFSRESANERKSLGKVGNKVFELQPPTADAAATATEKIIGKLSTIQRRRAKVPDKVFPAFAHVMIHLWTASKEEFQKASPEQRRGHIFQDLVRLSNWVNDENLTAEVARDEASE